LLPEAARLQLDARVENVGGGPPLRSDAARHLGAQGSWLASRCPVKLVNYELLTRDEEFIADPQVHFDVVVLDEAQRIKNKESKTACIVAPSPAIAAGQ